MARALQESLFKMLLSNVLWTLAACIVFVLGLRWYDGFVDWKFVLEFGFGSALATMGYQLLTRGRTRHREFAREILPD